MTEIFTFLLFNFYFVLSALRASAVKNSEEQNYGGKNSRKNQSRYLAARRAAQPIRAGEERRRRAGGEKFDQSRF
jgi:hypothetical protein